MRLIKMFLSKVLNVLVILCVLVSSCRGLEASAKSVHCDVQKDDNKIVVSCSHRNIDSITSWPQEVNAIDKGLIDQIRISYYNNTIKNVTKLPPLAGNKISLGFTANQIAEIEESAFSNVDRIVSLDLGSNRITGQVLRSEIFQGPYKNNVYGDISLQILNLAHNEIHSLDRYLFQHTPNLTSLFLNNNPLETLDHVSVLAISSATNLQTLDLSYTEIDSIPMATFSNLMYLRYIDLSGNKFITVPESLNLVGGSLETLTFNNNSIEELNDDSFVGLRKLQQLEVSNNEYLLEVKRSTFSPLVNLKILHLCHNPKLRYISHNAFRGLKDKWTLSEVYLNDNHLSELSTDLMPWSKLEILGMTKNNWLCNCDLADIVTTQKAGEKFKPKDIPVCAAPMKLSGAYITDISLTYCPTFDSTFLPKKNFSLSDLKPRHVLWSIFGVASVVCVGMLIGLMVNYTKRFYKKQLRSQSGVNYSNLNEDLTDA
ncbi:leucine-rich repeat-containing protein let-4-like isoform X2 [Hyposmocoma kahamanoa]|uniref:leucine-rich repeat-containing protein let-4-like isoform X2 n=1 Tax=Hyposmocoma kahamanoa TaxID=1477025 RepID=UPI000E6D79DB|nr:leucine-rich repeat-containing protein let-4-like isoform X2 [Hyposmocoma kahamanoa]